MKIGNDYTTLENKFEGFDKEYQLYMLDILLDYMIAYGKNSIDRIDVYEAIRNLLVEEKQELVTKTNNKTLVKRIAC